MDQLPLSTDYEVVLETIREKGKSLQSRDDFLSLVCRSLREIIPHYDWVGYYLVDPAAKQQLVLGPYQGEPTEHVRIAFGQGICGQAAEQRATVVVPDVRLESNYLSCSLRVRSEIVVPVIKEGMVVGELDIDSHTLNAFGPEDCRLLERLAEMSAGWF